MVCKFYLPKSVKIDILKDDPDLQNKFLIYHILYLKRKKNIYFREII